MIVEIVHTAELLVEMHELSNSMEPPMKLKLSDDN